MSEPEPASASAVSATVTNDKTMNNDEAGLRTVADEDAMDLSRSSSEEEEEANDEPSEQAEDEAPSSLLPPPATPPRKQSLSNGSTKKRRHNKTHRVQQKLFRDALTVEIPLNVTADLALAWKPAREKRIQTLYKTFPSLNPNKDSVHTKKKDVTNDDKISKQTDKDGENDPKKATNSTDRKKTKDIPHVPRPKDFSNMIEYLEAKYTQGILVDDEDLADDDDDEGQGSVYSEDSFFDDTDLTRTVAEQVLAQQTTTKLQMQNDDSEFFVNVGDLEVEESELTKEHYDPLEDSKKDKVKKKPSVTRKRKKPTATTSDKDGSPKKKTKNTNDSSNKSTVSSKSVASAKSATSKKKKNSNENDKPNKDPSPTETDAAGLKVIVTDRKKTCDKRYEELVALIKGLTTDALPRRKTKERVSLTCPKDKNPGDMVQFSNPHVPGQRLKVKIPKNTAPGGTFKVSVPVQEEPVDDSVDHNTWNRSFYDALDDYARAYDAWCDAEGDFRKASGDKEYTAHFEKRKKYENLVNEFPKDLKTPIDDAYMKKILRRARQNRSKRVQSVARLGAAASPTKASKAKVTADKKTSDEASTTSTTTTVKLRVPLFSKQFPSKTYSPEDFQRKEIK